MKKDIKLLLFPLLALALFGLALTLLNKEKPKEEVTSALPPEISAFREGGYTMGPADAKVTVVEFFDPECEGCAAFHPIFKSIIAEYPNVRFATRYMLFHGNSYSAALALEAAGAQGKYWEMYNFLLERQSEWSHQKDPVIHIFEKFAKELKLDIEKFNTAYDDLTFKATLARDVSEGKLLGVKGTPTFFINGKILTSLSQEALKAAIEEELHK